MIQRIQSIWLLLAATSSLLTIKFPFYTGNKVIADQTGFQFEQLNATSNLFLLLLTAATSVLALVSIFLYKDRKQQTRIGIVGLLTAILTIVLYFVYAKDFTNGDYSITACFAFLAPIFIILALRGIRKDQKLVKSLNRLR